MTKAASLLFLVLVGCVQHVEHTNIVLRCDIRQRTVVFEDDPRLEPYRPAMEAAIVRWNVALGYDFFVEEGGVPTPFRVNNDMKAWAWGGPSSGVSVRTGPYEVCGEHGCVISHPANANAWEDMMVHELGHVLGLMHDSYDGSSVMMEGLACLGPEGCTVLTHHVLKVYENPINCLDHY